MPKSKPASSDAPRQPEAALPDHKHFRTIQDFLMKFGQTLEDAGVVHDIVLLTNTSCSALIQSAGLGVLISNEGEISLISPYGHIENLITITEESEWQQVFDELDAHLGFCQTLQMDDDTLGNFSDFGDRVNGFWIVSIDSVLIEKNPRILEESETLPPLDVEDEWTRLTGE